MDAWKCNPTSGRNKTFFFAQQVTCIFNTSLTLSVSSSKLLGKQISRYESYLYLFFFSGTTQMTYSQHKHYKQTEQNDLTLPKNQKQPITTNLQYLNVTVNNIIEKLTDQFIWTSLRTFDWQQLFTNSDDDFCSGCWMSVMLPSGSNHLLLSVFYIL